MKVLVSKLQKYISRAVIDEETFDKMEDAILEGKKYVDVPESRLAEFEMKRIQYEAQEKLMWVCVELNNLGIKHEKNGNIESAIKTYEKNIKHDYPAHNSFKRLMILYRKEKDYDNEIRVIKRAIEVFGYLTEYTERLTKARRLQQNLKL